MSVYNLETQSAFNYYVKHRQHLQQSSDREYVNNYFLIGEKVNKKEQLFSQVMVEILCTENCELINYINDKLNGKLEPRKSQYLDGVEIDNGGHTTYNITQVVEKEMKWTDTSW